MSESKPLILNTTPPTVKLPSSTGEREAVLAVLAPLYPSLVQWRKDWDASHPKQKITSRYITVEDKESTK